MPQAPESFRTFLDTLRRVNFASAVDIALIAVLIFAILLWLKGSSGMSLVKGAALIVVTGVVLGSLLDLTVVNWLLRNSVPALLVAVPIVFQPEIRRALDRLGRTRVATRRAQRASERVIETLCSAAMDLSARRLGALVVIERETGLDDYIRTGTPLDASPTVRLIINLFWKNSPLHDGAVVVQENRIAAAGCILPLAEPAIGGHLGTRHRAALGLSERTDALIVVVSEETGAVSIAVNGQLLRTRDVESLHRALLGHTGLAERNPLPFAQPQPAKQAPCEPAPREIVEGAPGRVQRP